MKYYAVINSNLQTVDTTKQPVCPDGYIEMLELRPSPEYIANDKGEWVLPTEKQGDTEEH